MIEWESIQGLQGIERLGGLLHKWHGLQLFWSDSSGGIKTKEGVFSEALREEVRRKSGEFSDRNARIFDSGKLIAVPLIHEGKYLGAVWGRSLANREVSSKKAEYLAELITLIRDKILRGAQGRGKQVGSHAMIGKSRRMREVYDLLEKVSSSEASVFIQGANGTGKELVARAVYEGSLRKNKIFLAVNCSAFNDNLLDSELFGHIKGAFTGAFKSKKGLFEQADGGTLFLDEIGDTSPAMQVKLLRVIQEGTYLPVGATSPQKCDVRIIASTNRPLEKMMAGGKFREDLYYRLNVININLPILAQRKEDIPLLVDHFMERTCRELGVPLKRLSKEAMERIFDYNWPGNVRELQNELERLAVLSGEAEVISADLLAPRISHYPPLTLVKGGQEINVSGKLKDAIEEVERKMIREGLRRCSFNKSRLARELGISRANLIAKVYKYGLDERRPERRREAA